MSQLTDMFKGLLFLQGHSVDAGTGRFPPELGNRAASAQWFATHAGGERSGRAADELSAIEHLGFLGGRPMHAGHNLDLDDPFEQLRTAANEDPPAPARAAC